MRGDEKEGEGGERARHTPPLPCRTSANAWARFHKRLPRGWVLDNALVTSNTDASCVSRPRGVGQIGPLDLVSR